MGSLQESVLLAVYHSRQMIDLQKTLLLFKAAVMPDSKQELTSAVKELVSTMFPYLSNEEQAEKDQTLERNRRFIAAGPIAFTPQMLTEQFGRRSRGRFDPG